MNARSTAADDGWAPDAVLDAIPEGIVLYDEKGVPVRANAAAVRGFGFDPAGADRGGLAIRLAIRHPDGRPVEISELPSSRALAGETVRNAPFLFVGADGREIAILASASPVRSGGRIMGAVAVWRDITERERLAREAGEAASRAHVRARLATRLGSSLSAAQVLHALCEEAAEIFGVSASAVLTFDAETDVFRPAAARGLPLHGVRQIPPLSRGAFAAQADPDGRILHLPDVGAAAGLSAQDYAALGVRGLAAASLVHQDRLVGALVLYALAAERRFTAGELALLREVADQAVAAVVNAQLYEEVRRQRQQLRLLAGWLAEAEEGERRRLARELHDQVGQNLTALSIALNVVRNGMTGRDDAGLVSRLDDASSLVKQTTATIRSLMAELRPPVLDDYGLGEALRWYGERFTARTGLPVEVMVEDAGLRLPFPVENALFRIAQEALTNVAKHARALHATVRLEVDGRAARLTVTDDGAGFEVARSAGVGRERGWGLVAMRERAEAAGGRFEIRSRPGEGTAVSVEIRRP